MAGAVVSAATGVVAAAVSSLTALLVSEYKLAGDVRSGVRFLRDELSSMDAALQRLQAEADDGGDHRIDAQTREWRSKVRELSYDIQDCADRFTLLRSSGESNQSFARRMARNVRRRLCACAEDRELAREIRELKARVVEVKERRDRYHIGGLSSTTTATAAAAPGPGSGLLDPRALAFYEEARDLVGIDGPREQIVGWIAGSAEEEQLKVVAIFGVGGQGKTTLAMEVYRNAREQFDCCASVTVSRTLDINRILRDILSQTNKSAYERSRSERWETEQLIRATSDYLMDKRYLIVIDDIWSIEAWRQVQCALPVNNCRSRIITTTRKKDVAESCCTSIDGHIYEAKPLSEDDSHILFFRRVFHSNEDCPQVLRVLASEILRKCGGLPLAIITIGGMLARRSHRVEEWEEILKSVSSAVGTAPQFQEMKRILLLSYFDLPCYLKSCLLYLSLFPEDYSIDCRHLTRAWVAEGLIHGHSRESMELVAVKWLNELINASMIQPTKIRADGAVKFCKVHDVILDIIVSQAAEDNFVVVKNGEGFSVNSSNKMRRLSIQTDFSGAEEMANALKQNVPHLRSIHIFTDSSQLGDHIPRFFNSYVLRVLNVQGQLHFGGRNNVHVQSFTQLKYLVITGNNWELPEQIGKLQYLETLDVRRSGINKLPASIVHLKKLVRLFFPRGVQLPDGIGNLQHLEELSMIELDTSSAEVIQELGDMSRLGFLIAFSSYNFDEGCGSQGHKEASISSLSKLFMRLRTLYLVHDSDVIAALMTTANCASSTPPLQRLYLPNPLTSIPRQMRSLANLVRLRFSVSGEVTQEGLEILASLPMLASLTVRLKDNPNSGINPRRHVIPSEGFRSLVKFSFGGDHEAALEFEAGAMAKVNKLKLELQARCQFKFGQGGLLVGLHNLASLKYINASISCLTAIADEVKGLEDDIRGTAGTHPNRPTLVVRRERSQGYEMSR